jgi:hypothetical protein
MLRARLGVAAALLAGSSSAALLGGAPTAGRSVARSLSSSCKAAAGVYDFSARDLTTDENIEFSRYAGQVSLIVNVASK